MLSYKDVVFTDELIREISTTVDRASDEAVMEFVRKHQDLAKGFQIRKTGCATFRKRISQHFIAMHELDDAAVKFLYCHGVGQQFVAVLSSQALAVLQHEFAAILGHSAFTLALLLDPRANIHRFGRNMQRKGEDRNLDKETARKVVVENMHSFIANFSLITDAVTDKIPPAVPYDPEKNIPLQMELKAEQKRNCTLATQLKEEKERAQILLAEKAERIEKLLAERNVLRSSSAGLRNQIDSLQAELEQLRLTYDTDLTSSVESRLEGLTNGWLKTCIQHEQRTNCSKAKDLLARADEVISLQVQADRHTGNRRELQLRLSAVSAKLAEVRDIRANALKPIEDLSYIERQLVAEEHDLSRLLGSDGDSRKTPMVQALAARINSASEGENIHKLEQFLDELHQLGLPDSDFAFLQNKLAVLYDRLLSQSDDAPLLQLPLNPTLRFRFALAQGQPLTLVCDGHNILNSMDMFTDVRNRSHSDARKSLSDILTVLLKPYQCCTATIVYDGPDHNKVECSENVTVIYSGGGKNEKHRADRRIEEMLNWRQYTGKSAPVFVVTADYDLGQEAKESGAEIISLEHFE